MLGSIIGKKIGMTQIFTDNGVVIPVTIIGIKKIYVTQVKSPQRDGYSALQLGLVKDKYLQQPYSSDWNKEKNKYFSSLREVALKEELLPSFKEGQEISLKDVEFGQGAKVNVSGKSKGLGFQGVVKRWGFGGGPGSHGSNFHRKPGAISGMTSQGNVVKGKKLPGHCGSEKTTTTNLKIASMNKEEGYLFVKGAIPGKKNSLVVVSKQG